MNAIYIEVVRLRLIILNKIMNKILPPDHPDVICDHVDSEMSQIEGQFTDNEIAIVQIIQNYVDQNATYWYVQWGFKKILDNVWDIDLKDIMKKIQAKKNEESDIKESDDNLYMSVEDIPF